MRNYGARASTGRARRSVRSSASSASECRAPRGGADGRRGIRVEEEPLLFSGPALDDIDVVLKCDGLRDFDSEYQSAINVALVPGLPPNRSAIRFRA